MGVYEIPAGISSKQETHIPAYERKCLISQPDKEVKSDQEEVS